MQLWCGVGEGPEKVMYVQLLFSIDFRLHFTVGLCMAHMVWRSEKASGFKM